MVVRDYTYKICISLLLTLLRVLERENKPIFHSASTKNNKEKTETMNLFDYHLHTRHSFDGQMTVSTLCDAAIQKGLSEICIADHTEFGHPSPSSDVPPNIEEWSKEIDIARQEYPAIVIRKGIEIGDNPLCRDRIKKWHLALDVDFLLLSLHLVQNQDPYWPEFFDGRSMDAAYQKYVEAKLESVLAWNKDEYDALAHLGYCAKFSPYPIEQRPLRRHHAPDLFDQILRVLVYNGKPLEINTSGIRSMRESIPGKELLIRFHELGGEFVTIGSDAHHPNNVGFWIAEAQQLAVACGFRYQATFENRRMKPVSL